MLRAKYTVEEKNDVLTKFLCVQDCFDACIKSLEDNELELNGFHTQANAILGTYMLFITSERMDHLLTHLMKECFEARVKFEVECSRGWRMTKTNQDFPMDLVRIITRVLNGQPVDIKPGSMLSQRFVHFPNEAMKYTRFTKDTGEVKRGRVETLNNMVWITHMILFINSCRMVVVLRETKNKRDKLVMVPQVKSPSGLAPILVDVCNANKRLNMNALCEAAEII